MCPRITRARSRGPLKNSLLVHRGCTQRIPPEERTGERISGGRDEKALCKCEIPKTDRLTRSRISRIWRVFEINQIGSLVRVFRARKIYRFVFPRNISLPVLFQGFALLPDEKLENHLLVEVEESRWLPEDRRLINSCGTDACRCLSNWNEANAFYGEGWGILMRASFWRRRKPKLACEKYQCDTRAL